MKVASSKDINDVAFTPELLNEFKVKTLEAEDSLSLKQHNKKLKVYFN